MQPQINGQIYGPDGQILNRISNSPFPECGANILEDDGKTAIYRWLMRELGSSNQKSESGVTVDTKNVMGLFPVFRCINIIAGIIASTNCFLYAKGPNDSRDIQTDHDAFNLVLHRPSSMMKARRFKHTLAVHALLLGNGFAEIVTDGKGNLRELVLLDPLRISFGEIKDKETGEERKVYLEAPEIDDIEESREIAPESIIHIAGVTWDGITGLDVVRCLADEFGHAIAIRNYAAKYFVNSAHVAGYFTIPIGFDHTYIKDFFSAMTEHTTSVQHGATKALPLFDGVKFQPATNDPEKSQLLESQDSIPRRLGTIFGVPPHLLGDKQSNSYSSLEEEVRGFTLYTLNDWFNEFETEFNFKLLTKAEEKSGYYFEFNRTALLSADSETMAQMIREDVNGGIVTPNEGRRKKNMPTIPGEENDTLRLPRNIVGNERAFTRSTTQNNALRESITTLAVSSATRMCERLSKSFQRAVKNSTENQWLTTISSKDGKIVNDNLYPIAMTAWRAGFCEVPRQDIGELFIDMFIEKLSDKEVVAEAVEAVPEQFAFHIGVFDLKEEFDANKKKN